MDSEKEIAALVKELDESTNRLVAEGLKQVNDEMDRKRAYAKAVVEIHGISPRVGRKVAEKIWDLKNYGDIRTYAKIVKFWAARNPYDAVDGADKLPEWMSKVGEDKDAYAELVMSVDRPVFLSMELAGSAASLNRKERAGCGKDYARLLRDVGGFYNRDMAINSRKDALEAAGKIFGFVQSGKLKEAESYVSSLSGQKHEIRESGGA